MQHLTIVSGYEKFRLFRGRDWFGLKALDGRVTLCYARGITIIDY